MSHTIIGCGYAVSNSLGAGFLEKVYRNALAHEMQKAGLTALKEQDIPVYYDGIEVGGYRADLIVEQIVIIEVKAVRALDEVHFAQCMNYLRATGIPLCLLMNFGNPKLEIKRVVGKTFAQMSQEPA